ncbi:hypothetical protein TUMEXPCC7403_01045 [Tumidithrix helvetica PCC 7403]|uniref:hypothetical protein n=1 Tax=Tumidithrix helvetica TaxID=3457545 RepID=UPI003C89620F
MTLQLTPTEIETAQQLLHDYAPAQEVWAYLSAANGNLDECFDRLIEAKNPRETYGEPQKSLWQSTLKILRQELCGDEGFRGKVKEYSKNPGSTPLLTGLIVSLVGVAGLPIDPAIATVIALYIIKVGLNIFCEYTESRE